MTPVRDDIALPFRVVPRVCAVLGCAPDDALYVVRSLPMDPGGRWLTCPDGTRLLVDVALPFKDGIAFRVVGVAGPRAPEGPETPTPAAPTAPWTAVAALRTAGYDGHYANTRPT